LYYTVDSAFQNHGEVYNVSYTVLKGSDVAGQIKNKSQEGKTPIKELLVDGHSGPGLTYISGKVGGVKTAFHLSDLMALNQTPSFSRAKSEKGPVRCWFRRDSTVRLSACQTKGFASAFASTALRQGSKAWGTQHNISVIDGPFGIGKRLRHHGYGPGGFPAVLGTTGTGAGIYSATWIAFPGTL
jgi:hypothetical protein